MTEEKNAVIGGDKWNSLVKRIVIALSYNTHLPQTITDIEDPRTNF